MMNWPQSKEEILSSPVIAHAETATHSVSYTADGLLHIEVNPDIPEEELPEFVRKAAKVPGNAVGNEDVIKAIREVLSQVGL